MIEIGIISEARGDRARVTIGQMVSDFLPVFQMMSNSFAVSFSPIRVGEQVLVIPVRDELNSGVILRGLYQNKHKAKATDSKIYISFEDGAMLSYDTSNSLLNVDNIKTINISSQNINIIADNCNISASASINGDVLIKGNLEVGGIIKDKLGDLTNHTHNNTAQYWVKVLPR